MCLPLCVPLEKIAFHFIIPMQVIIVILYTWIMSFRCRLYLRLGNPSDFMAGSEKMKPFCDIILLCWFQATTPPMCKVEEWHPHILTIHGLIVGGSILWTPLLIGRNNNKRHYTEDASFFLNLPFSRSPYDKSFIPGTSFVALLWTPSINFESLSYI